MVLPPVTSAAADAARRAAVVDTPPPLPPRVEAALQLADGAPGARNWVEGPQWEPAFNRAFRFEDSVHGKLDAQPQPDKGLIRVVGTSISTTCIVKSVDRVYPDETRVRVYTPRGPRAAAVLSVNDTAAPIDRWVRYEAELTCDGATQHFLFSHWTKLRVPQPQVADKCVPVLVSDLYDTERSVWTGLLSIDALSYAGRNESFNVIGRHNPVFVSDVRNGPTTTLSVLTRTFAERSLFLSVVYPGRILLIRNPNRRFGIENGLEVLQYGYPEDNWYVAVGDVTEERIASDAGVPLRKFSFDVTLVDRPAALIENQMSRSYRVLRDYKSDEQTLMRMTYQDVLVQYALPLGKATYANVFYGISTLQAPTAVHPYYGLGDGRSYRYTFGDGVFPTRSAVRTSWGFNAP
jgi:hypothetical protein